MTTAGYMGMTPDGIYAVPDEVIGNIMSDRIAQGVKAHWRRSVTCHRRV